MSIISCSLTTIALQLLLASCIPSSSHNSDPNKKTPSDSSSIINTIKSILLYILILWTFILIIYIVYRIFKAFCKCICGKEDENWNSGLAARVIFVHRNLNNPTELRNGLGELMKELENEKGTIPDNIKKY